MKTKHLSFWLTVFMMLVGQSLFAHDFKVGDIYYNITSGKDLTVEVTYCDGYGFHEYSGDVTIPNSVSNSGRTYSVTRVGDRAFSGSDNLTSVTIPNSVTSIGSSAFYDCWKLYSITIPNSVTSIGNSAFMKCPLRSITIPNSVTSIGNSAFYDCKNLSNIILGNSVTSIGDYAFVKCPFANIIIPNSVTSIGNNAFSGCEHLANIIIPNSVTSIGDGTFNDCWDLSNIILGNNVTSIGSGAFYDCWKLRSITIPNSVTSIGESAFYNCKSLTSITIPNSVTSIGNNAFKDCRNLISIDVENGNPKYDSRNSCNAIIETGTNALIVGCNNTVIPNSVTSISDRAFSGCGSLTSITIPNSVTSIGDYAFEHCESLTSITIPNSVTSIGESAFLGCKSLTSITIPNSVTSISESAFWGCESLTSITIPNSVTRISKYAFSGCSSLTSITIPSSVTNILDYAFDDCPLKDVTCLATTPPSISSKTFTDLFILHVLPGYGDTYRLSYYWKDNIIKEDAVEQDDDQGDDNISVTKLTLNSTSKSMSVGDTYQLSVTVSPKDATDKSVTWMSSNSRVASVSTNGLVSAKSEGTATITCYANDNSGKSASCTVTVTNNGVPPVEEDTTDENYEELVAPSTDKAVSVGVCYTAGKNGELTNSTDEDGFIKIRTGNNNQVVFNVNSGYIITGIEILGYSNNTSTMADRTIYLTSVLIDDSETSIISKPSPFYGGKVGCSLTDTELNNFIATKKIVLNFDNKNIVSSDVDSNGKNKQIYARILFTYKKNTLVNKITLNSTSKTMTVGDTYQLSATVSPEDAKVKTVNWSSSSTSVAFVNARGLVMAQGEGTATITCTATDGSGTSASCVVTVKKKNVPEEDPTAVKKEDLVAPAVDKAKSEGTCYIAGENGELTNSTKDEYIKIRTGNDNMLVIGVKPGYNIIGIDIEGYSNNTSTIADRSIKLTSVLVDDAESSILAKAVTFKGGTASQNPTKVSLTDFAARKQIVLTFDNSKIVSSEEDSAGKNKQIYAKMTFTYQIANGIELISQEEFNAATKMYNVHGQSVNIPVKGQLYIKNGKKIIFK